MTNCVRILTVVLLLTTCSAVAEDQTLRLDDTGDWRPVSPENDELRLAISEAKERVITGDHKGAKLAYDKVRLIITRDPNNLSDKDPNSGITKDLDMFIEGELHFAKGKLVKAVRTYNRILVEHRRGFFFEAALDREFQIATAYLAGRKKTIIAFIKIKGYAEGVKMMEKIAEWAEGASLEPLRQMARIAIAEHYEQRRMFVEAHGEWETIMGDWPTGPIGQRALLSMARNEHAAYNKQPEEKRAQYDGSPLEGARTYYLQYAAYHPVDADKLAVDEIIVEIDEQIADKKFAVATYYLNTEKLRAANFYFDMILRKWPDTKAAEMTREIVNSRNKNETEDEDNQGENS